ncbi:MAG TPA: anaerobic sulfatase maturase [Bryobacteraceae bacterium]|nr:anaerobic sulfatase maturase [Bryobacteraceae bacterium]
MSGEFQVFVKPAGAFCNLDCGYCYYRDKRSLYPGAGMARMPDSLLEEYIVQHIAAARGPEIHFSWHGGEPTTLGVDFFRRAVELQRKHRPAGWRIRNGIQTNGVLLDEEWCRFLAAGNFRIGLSLDGPAELHDPYRVNRGGQPTHRFAMRGYQLLRRHEVPTDILCVAHNLNAGHPLTVYRFFREIGASFLGFLPAVEQAPDNPEVAGPYTPAADAYGAFLCKIFDEWLARDTARIAVQAFEEAARPALGLEHSLCVFRETCGQVPVLEHNGDFFPCDHYVDPEHRLGNIRETPLAGLLESPAQRAFGEAKRDRLPRYCRECEVLAMCHGGCPKYRFIRTPDGEPGLNYLCAGLKRFFLHSRAPLARMVAQGRELAPAFRAAQGQAGRNDPCPCGSGRKYKKCCGGG